MQLETDGGAGRTGLRAGTSPRSRRQAAVWFGGSQTGLPGAVRVADPSGNATGVGRFSKRLAGRTDIARQRVDARDILGWLGRVAGKSSDGPTPWVTGSPRAMATWRRTVFGIMDLRVYIPGSGRIHRPVAFGLAVGSRDLRMPRPSGKAASVVVARELETLRRIWFLRRQVCVLRDTSHGPRVRAPDVSFFWRLSPIQSV